MCGIVGYVGKEKCIPKIISGLESLEYRGYDSAGLACLVNGEVQIVKEQGRIENLKDKINLEEESYLGIGHTRWATHGKPCQVNSHPHRVGLVTIVHNGIVENYEELKHELKEYEFVSETDSEVVAALIDKLYREYNDILKVLNILKDKLVGSYALGIMIDGINKLYAVRKDSPLIVGVTENGNFIASDVPAILNYTNMYYLLLNNEYVEITEDDVVIYDMNGDVASKNLLTFDGTSEAAQKNGYEHFMLKEIYEQPKVIANTVSEYIKDFDSLRERMENLEKFDEIDIVGCGSAYHVGLVGKSLLTKYGKVRVNVDIASEYRYTEHIYSKNHLVLVISQSGETADTLAVLRNAKSLGIPVWAIVNVVGSSIAREADKVLYIKAGPEIAVATTKAYMCQMMILSLMATYLGIRNKIVGESIFEDYKNISEELRKMLENTTEEEKVAEMIYKNKDIFYLGRKIDYSLSLEASLKLKEVSYLHSEAYAAGELKHGTISLVEDGTPVISIITDDDIRLKTLSNVKEVCARGALSIVISNEDIADKDIFTYLIKVPKMIDLVGSVLVVAKCQLIAYYVAKLNGCDIDKPRNLAKSVTVE